MLLDWCFFGSRSASQRVAAPSPRQGKIEAMEQFPFHLGGGGGEGTATRRPEMSLKSSDCKSPGHGKIEYFEWKLAVQTLCFSVFFFPLAMSFIVRVDLINFQTGCLKSPPTSHTRGHLIISYCSRLFCDVSAKDSKI